MTISASDRRLLPALLSGRAVTSDEGDRWVILGQGEVEKRPAHEIVLAPQANWGEPA